MLPPLPKKQEGPALSREDRGGFTSKRDDKNMQPKLYVGNLSYDAKDSDLQNLFSKYGNVQSATIISDRFTGRSKGFGFVEMASGEEAEKALALNGTDFLGRNITVSEARPKESGSEGRRPRSGRNF